MATPTVFTRLLDDLAAESALIVPTPGLVDPKGFRPWESLNPADFPAVLFELADEGEQELKQGPGGAGSIAEDAPFDIFGYVNTAESDPDGRVKVREAWLAAILNRLLAVAFTVRLSNTMAANGGNGCLFVRTDGGAARDKGLYGSQWGLFRQPMIARMHYTRGAM